MQADNKKLPFPSTSQSSMWFSITFNTCVFFSFWTTYLATNRSTSRSHLKTSTLSYLLQHVFWRDTWSPLCPKFHHVPTPGQACDLYLNQSS
jgi:hypothetical protein